AIAVDSRHERSDRAACDAAVVQREVLHLLPRPDAKRSLRTRTRAGGRRQRRHAAVLRIDDERRVAERPRALLVAEGAGPRVVDIARALTIFRALRELLI